MSRYLVEGERNRPGDMRIDTISLDVARQEFANLVAEGSPFVTITELHGTGTAGSREIARFSSYAG